MNTKEKAQELVNTILDKLYNDGSLSFKRILYARAVECAKVTVDEILKNFEGLHKPEYCAFDAIGERKFTFESEYPEHMTGYDMVAYWEDVKVQIEALS